MLHLYTLGTVNLTDADGQPCVTLLAQRKRLAFLLYLTLTARGGPTRRDTLLPLFWPERSEVQGRHALRQILHYLRRSLESGAVVNRMGEGLLVDLTTVYCDAIAFERALDAGHLADALALYGGDLLPGLFVSDAPQFEQWLEEERSRLRRRASDAAWRLARQHAAEGDAAAAEHVARRAAGLTPGDEVAVCQLIGVLEQVGNFSAAIRAYEQFAETHVAEYGVPPAAETRALVQRIRTRVVAVEAPRADKPSAAAAPPITAAGVAAPAVAAPPPAIVDGPRRRSTGVARLRARFLVPRTRWVVALAGSAGAAVVALALVGAMVVRHSEGDARAVAATETAHKLYALGLRAASQADDRNAARFFLASLAEDSSSALAAYHAALSEVTYGDRWTAQRDFSRAWRLAAHASAHDALTIRQSFAAATNDRRALALAESMVAQFPGEAEGELALGRALSWSGDYLAAVPHLRRAISIDSAERANPDAPLAAACWACQAYNVLVAAYRSADSLRAAERMATAWAASYPTDPTAWFFLAQLAEEAGRGDSALVLGRRGNTVTQTMDEAIRRARVAIRVGAFADADRLLEERARDGTPDDRREALWWLITSLRTQGRMVDAMEAATRYRANGPNSLEGWSNNGTPPMLPAAQVAFEAGRYAEAAAAYDTIRRLGRPEPQTAFFDAPTLVMRHTTWIAIHEVTARVAAGDTVGLAAFADSIARWGSIEGYSRDRRLHFYATGLLLAARGDTAGAIDALKRSIDSPVTGYTRAGFEAARLLLAQGRSREAIAMLQPALRGGLDSSNWYVTRTELHDLLARAFAAAGARDSAAVHYAYVASAWRRGDAPFRARASVAAAFHE
jgi:DNA-binding SARP family transcriptional activator